MRHFLKISKYLGQLPDMVQGAGGNISVKINDTLVVKSSGTFLKNITPQSGFVTCRRQPLIKALGKIKHPNQKTELQFDRTIEQNMDHIASYGIPSIETSFHLSVPSTYIVHTHPVYVNIFSCMEKGEEMLVKIFKNTPFLFLPYYNPGLALGLALSKYKNLPKIIILKNHGLITHSDNPKESLRLTKIVNEKIITFLKKKKVFKPFKVSDKRADLSHHLFPDSAVYSQVDFSKLPIEKRRVYYEICSTHNYIFDTIKALNEKPNFLKQKDVDYILNMQKEKYRINKIKQK